MLTVCAMLGWDPVLMQGKLTYDEEGRTFYEGEWKDGVKAGVGLMQYGSGNVYEGEWVDDRVHGRGVSATRARSAQACKFRIAGMEPTTMLTRSA